MHCPLSTATNKQKSFDSCSQLVSRCSYVTQSYVQSPTDATFNFYDGWMTWSSATTCLTLYYINIRQKRRVNVKVGIVTSNNASRLHVHIGVHNNNNVVTWYDYRYTLTFTGPLVTTCSLNCCTVSRRVCNVSVTCVAVWQWNTASEQRKWNGTMCKDRNDSMNVWSDIEGIRYCVRNCDKGLEWKI